MASPDVLLGAGLYETVRVSEGFALHGERHLERMHASAHALGLPAPERAAFAGAIAGAVAAARSCASACMRRTAHPSCEPSGAALVPAPLRLTALGGWYAPGYLLREHKLTSHFHGVQGRRLAQAAGFDDALLVAHDGRVGEATNANVAHIAAGVLVTPSIDGLLPGVCRAALLEVARGLGLAVEARPVALAELIDADGVARHVVAARDQRGRRARRPRAAARCARSCSGVARAAWPRRPAPTRWRYRERVSPAAPSPGRPRARGRPARARHRAGGRAARARGAGQRAAGVRQGPLVVPRALARRRALAARSRRARSRRRASCSTGSPPTCLQALRRSRGGLLGSLGYDLARALERDSAARARRPRAAGDAARGRRLALRLRPRARRAVDRRARRARAAPSARGARARAPGAPRPAAPGRRAARHAVRPLPRARRARARPHRARRRLRGQLHAAARGKLCQRAGSLRAPARDPRPCRTTSTSTRAAGSSWARRPRRSCASAPDGRCETRPIKGTRPRGDDPLPMPRSRPISRRIPRIAPRT